MSDSAASGAGGSPGMSRGLILLLGTAGAVVSLAGLHAVASFFAPIFLALTLVVCVHPLLQSLRRRGWPSWLAVSVCLVIIYVLLLALIVALVLSIARFGQLIVQYAGQSQDFANSLSSFLSKHGVSNDEIQSALKGVDPSTVLGVAQKLLSGLSSSLSTIALLAATVFFMVADSVGVADRAEALANGPQGEAIIALGSFAAGVRKYWLVSTVFGLIVAVFDTAALFALGVPLALVWGLLSFLTNYIPNIGFVLGVVPPAVLALLDGGWWKFALVIVLYSVLNVVIQTFIQPRYTGDAVGLTVTASFLSLVLWGFILGPLGALLALPMSLFVKSVLIDADPNARWVNALISSKPPTRRAT